LSVRSLLSGLWVAAKEGWECNAVLTVPGHGNGLVTELLGEVVPGPASLSSSH
jgi:hypothetical protein